MDPSQCRRHPGVFFFHEMATQCYTGKGREIINRYSKAKHRTNAQNQDAYNNAIMQHNATLVWQKQGKQKQQGNKSTACTKTKQRIVYLSRYKRQNNEKHWKTLYHPTVNPPIFQAMPHHLAASALRRGGGLVWYSVTRCLDKHWLQSKLYKLYKWFKWWCVYRYSVNMYIS